ncbi:zinc ribbon domain-containing protein [Evansella sp. LMS18]|uniref:zinc ribbon domain-containing protein n=1 Tax=Evansella sp. LMS18 TaxID=2924033 RepID=UPI0020D0C916|nr:zinc ribbon domain-containing protein [Evansella sp. LMS18]UTR11758.1 zinc ribbon domain-containing protein [Evansella sp. LMS18]
MKFCSNCGNKIGQKDKFCGKCGTNLADFSQRPGEEEEKQVGGIRENDELETEETSEAGSGPAAGSSTGGTGIAGDSPVRKVASEERSNVHNKKYKPKKKGFIAIIMAAVLLLTVGGVSYGVFFNKSPKQVYLSAELNSLQDMQDSFEELFGDDMELSRMMSEKAYRSEMTITGGVDGHNIPEITQLNHYLSDSAIEVSMSQDPESAKGMASLALLLNGTNVFEAEAFQSDDQTGISVPFLYDEYFFINNNDFGSFMRGVDPWYYGPDRIENYTEYMTSSTEYEDELKKHGLEYVTFITSFLEDEHFTMESGQEYKGESFRKVTLSLSERDVKNLLEGLIRKLEQDEELQNLLLEMAESSGSFDEAYFSREDMLQEMRYGFSEMREGLEYMNMPGGFTSELLVDRGENIISRNVHFQVADPYYPADTMNFSYETSVWQNSDIEEITRELTVAPADPHMGQFTAYWNSETGNDQIVTNVGGKLIDYGDVAFDVRLSMDTALSGDTKETDFDLRMSGYEVGGDIPKINGTVIQTTDQNLGRNYSNRDFELVLNVGVDDYWAGYQEVNLNLAVESKTEFTSSLGFPDLSGDTAVNVFEMSEYELMMIMEEIAYNLENIMYQAGWY